MTKSIFIVLAMLSTIALSIAGGTRLQDKSTHHAAMHAEHWINHHVSPEHKKKKLRHRKVNHNDKTTHHTAMHAEHWLSDHVSKPHKN